MDACKRAVPRSASSVAIKEPPYNHPLLRASNLAHLIIEHILLDDDAMVPPLRNPTIKKKVQ